MGFIKRGDVKIIDVFTDKDLIDDKKKSLKRLADKENVSSDEKLEEESSRKSDSGED